MNDIYTIYEGLLRGMDDTISSGESVSKKIQIIDWLNDNSDYVKLHAHNITLDYSSRISLNDNGEFNIFELRPMNAYLQKNMMDLPVPDYIKFYKAELLTIIYPDSSYANKLSFKDLPHINHCDNLHFNGFVDNPIWVNLKDLKVDNINVLNIDMSSIRVNNWPKTHIGMVHLLTGGYIYGTDIEASIKRYNHDFDINLLNGLKTDALVLPDIMFTRRMNLIGYRVDVEITKDDPEYDTLKKLFDMKVFNKLYAYSVKGRTDIFRQIKFKKDRFVISKLNSNIYKKYYQKH